MKLENTMCWYCYWGLPKPIADIYEKHLSNAGFSAMHFGPAHIVWEDSNLDRDSIQWCLDHFDEYKHGHLDSELAHVRQSLVDLLALPDELLEYPGDEDSSNHEQNPPKPGWIMVKR